MLTFMFLAVTGSGVAVSVGGSQDSYLRAIVSLTGSVGLGGTGAFVALCEEGVVERR